MDNRGGDGPGAIRARDEGEVYTPLPPGVREKHGAWHLVTGDRSRKLCRVSDGRAALYDALHKHTGSAEGAVWHAILQYRDRGTTHLAAATQKAYRVMALRMLHHFGHWRLDDLEPTHCAQYLKWCRDEQRAVTGNREKAFMSSVYEFAMAEGWATRNPWRGVRRSLERPAREYVTHETLAATVDKAPPELQPLFGWAYLTGMRQTDCRLLRWENIRDGRVEWTEHKTGKRNGMAVTPTMRHFLALAAQRAGGSPFVFVSARGLPLSEWGLQSALRRFGAGFKFRSLRAKAGTDADGVLGHTGQLAERYAKRRTLKAVK
jgi:integrase